MIRSRLQARRQGRESTGRYTRQDFDHSPLIVFYEVTQACDLVCAHCRKRAQRGPHPSELNTQEACRLIDQLARFPKPPMLVLTGGDPLKRPDLFDLIDHARRAGMDVSITSSATPLMTDAALERLKAAGIARLAISLDGPDPRTHEGLRRVEGSFQRTLHILEVARRLGLRVQVNTVMTPINFRHVDRMADLLAGHQIVLWSVFFLVPVGLAASVRRLTAWQYEVVFEQLWKQSRRQRYSIKTTEAPQYRRFVLQRQLRNTPPHRPWRAGRHSSGRSLIGLNDGKGVMFVGHTGLIHPSGFMPIVCGLFPLDDVVHIYQQSPIFRALRDTERLEGKCGVCEYRHICGGSRARAMAVSGNPFQQEPDCAYVPKGMR